MKVYRSYCFTVRPTNGLTTKLEEALLKWLQRYEGFLCYEMEEVARHAHGVIYLNNPRSKGDVNKSLESICAREVPDWNASQNMVLRRGTKICYNDDFISEYLGKEDNVLYNNIPEDTSLFYPPPEEQLRVQEQSKAVDKRFYQYEYDFNQSNYKKVLDRNPRFSQQIVASFLEDMMFNTRIYPVIICPRRRKEVCKALHLYLIKQKNGTESLYKDDLYVLQFAIKNLNYTQNVMRPLLEGVPPDNTNKED